MSVDILKLLRPLYLFLRVTGMCDIKIDKEGKISRAGLRSRLTTVAVTILFAGALPVYFMYDSATFSRVHKLLINGGMYLFCLQVLVFGVSKILQEKKKVEIWKALVDMEKNCYDLKIKLEQKSIKYGGLMVIFFQLSFGFFLPIPDFFHFTLLDVLLKLIHIRWCANKAEYITLMSIPQNCFDELNKVVGSLKRRKGLVVVQNINADLRKIQKLHAELCRISRMIVDALSPQIIFYLLESVVTLVVLFYVKCSILYESNNDMQINMQIFLFLTIDSCITILTIILPSAMCVHNANKIKSSLRNINIFTGHPIERNIKLFSLQIIQEDFKITPGGLFSLDMGLCCTIVGTIATYIMIIIQFDVSYFT